MHEQNMEPPMVFSRADHFGSICFLGGFWADFFGPRPGSTRFLPEIVGFGWALFQASPGPNSTRPMITSNLFHQRYTKLLINKTIKSWSFLQENISSKFFHYNVDFVEGAK